MAIILKSDEKLKAIIDALPTDYSFDDFATAFKKEYEKDWLKINREYQSHEKKTKLGKSHPMPEPSQYLRNVLNVYVKKHNP